MFPAGSSTQQRMWPMEKWVELAKQVYDEYGLKVCLTGGKEDIEVAEDVVNKVRALNVNIISMAGKCSLNETKELLSRSKLLVSVNTGVMHMGAAVNIPLVALHGATSELRWGPVDDNSVVIKSGEACQPCISLGFETECDNPVCMENITVDMVMNGNAHVLVVGDVMLDQYFYGSVSRISPEAPVPINRIERQVDTLGGAANVAHNLAKLGCKTYLAGISPNGMITGREKTTTKLRVLGGHQQMLRMDFEETEPISEEYENDVLEYVKNKIENNIDIVIISDYGKGLCTKRVCSSIINIAHDKDIKVLVDPKGTDWDKYKNADFVTPNVKELGDVVGKVIKNDDDNITAAVKNVRDKYSITDVMVTRSEKGLSLYVGDEIISIPTVAQEVFDVSGAGDTVISNFATALACNLDYENAAYVSNVAAGVEVEKIEYDATKDVLSDEYIIKDRWYGDEKYSKEGGGI
ncbi:unnamed protein product [Cylicocyclus nassatus]|uniref:Carbohydrate kinase PfkB domain-containing protein n=1 Tax=Cylicocyclus nassatus TaxID=53992 RepID=A0AA36M384_CYLNA|nr:unnamed protein product [Cylicocyclus nassatus]